MVPPKLAASIQRCLSLTWLYIMSCTSVVIGDYPVWSPAALGLVFGVQGGVGSHLTRLGRVP